MTTWTPPLTTSLSTNDVAKVVDGLTHLDTRTAALNFVDTLADDGLVYVIACEVAYRKHLRRPEVTDADTYRAYLRSNA